MKALILCCGGSPEPLDFCIKNYKTDFYYFLHSKKTFDIVQELIIEHNIKEGQYSLKLVENHESLEDSYAKSREIIKELQRNFDEINVDFTGGTEPMVVGLVLAAIDEDCTYTYVGSKTSEARDKQGVGIVQSGFEELKSQRDPYDVFAVTQFNRGIEFFNKYQFIAAESYFDEAHRKLESENLKELSNFYLELVDVYHRWDKFKNVRGSKLTLNRILGSILNVINDSDYIRNQLMDNYPYFIHQIELNKEFLDLKLSKEGRIKPHNVKYYLPDLLNNSLRRIEEGKFDDAVARLYRSIELIAQMSLTDEEVINENNLWGNAGFSINIESIESKFVENDSCLCYFNDYNNAIRNKEKNFTLALKNSYKLLSFLGSEYAKNYLKDREIQKNINLRNRSILAHGLKAIEHEESVELYSQVFEYAKQAFPEIEKYMEMSKFPKFE